MNIYIKIIALILLTVPSNPLKCVTEKDIYNVGRVTFSLGLFALGKAGQCAQDAHDLRYQVAHADFYIQGGQKINSRETFDNHAEFGSWSNSKKASMLTIINRSRGITSLQDAENIQQSQKKLLRSKKIYTGLGITVCGIGSSLMIYSVWSSFKKIMGY